MIIKCFENFTDKNEYYKKLSQEDYNRFMYHSEEAGDNLRLSGDEKAKILKIFPEERLHKYHNYDQGRTLHRLEGGVKAGEYEMYIMAPYLQRGGREYVGKKVEKLCRLRIVKKKDNWYYVNKQINIVDNTHGAEWKYTWYECDNMDGLIMLLRDIKRGKEQKFKTV